MPPLNSVSEVEADQPFSGLSFLVVLDMILSAVELLLLYYSLYDVDSVIDVESSACQISLSRRHVQR